ncbi:MAG: hypothetical protein KGH69_05300, partial [Candidatus Micrarchaeota archaeon]|nr:hypothetical protein [Candidatus Micrarchaeota archaeon]
PGATAAYYLNGVRYVATFNSGNGPAVAGTGNLIIGAGQGGYSKVQISNVQLYNASLTATDIKSLYREGIGGTPINTQHLVGWWPLNGDANDYSGYYRNGNAIQVVQNANWQSGYTVPST